MKQIKAKLNKLKTKKLNIAVQFFLFCEACFKKLGIAFYFLFAAFIYLSKAMVMEGVSGEGASISHFKPASVTAFTVELPKAAILVLFCLNPGKF